MKRYSDSQILNEILKDAKDQIRYHERERNKEGRKKVTLIQKRDKAEKLIQKTGMNVDVSRFRQQVNLVESMIRYHDNYIEVANKIINKVKQLRIIKKNKVSIPSKLPIDEDLFVLSSSPLDHKGEPVICISGFVKLNIEQKKLLLNLLITMAERVDLEAIRHKSRSKRNE